MPLCIAQARGKCPVEKKPEAPVTASATTARAQSGKTRKAQKPLLIITEDDLYMFANGTWQRSWEKLGAHPDVQDGEPGWHFAVWAPDVASVHVVGDFNDWDATANPLTQLSRSGVWQGFVPRLPEGELYKFVIETKDGKLLYKADPYGFYAENVPGTASRLLDITGYDWKDGVWMHNRARHDHMERPLNIYEVHLGSWRRHGNEPQGEPDENGNYPGPGDPFPAQRGTFYTYDDLSAELVDYVRDMGYTHIELLPGDGAPLRRLVGLPAHRLLRRHLPLRHAQAAHALRRLLPQGGHRRHPRLGAGRLLRQRGGPRHLQRQDALRARDPSQLGHAQVRLRPRRGA